MTNFDWRTDEEQGWDRPRAAEPDKSANESRWRAVGRRARNGWRGVLAVVFVLAAVTTVGARAVALRVQAAEDAVREEVRAAHYLAYDAARNGDEELYTSVLGGDRAWQQAQETTFEHNAVFGRSVLGLKWQVDLEPLTEFELSPDLQQALVTSTVTYEGYTGGDGTQPVMLQHVWRYENDGTQWRLMPHEEGFWQGWVTANGENVQTVMPRRDEALADRLNEDIGARLDPICEVLGHCPRPFRLHLRFEQNPETLHTPSTWITAPRDRLTISLPAPSLLGVPVNEVSYRALLNGYLRIVVNELLNSFVLRDPTNSDPFREALSRQIAVELDLTSWPPAPKEAGSTGQLEAGSDILALCVGQGAEDASLLRYHAAAATWETAFEERDVTRMLALDGAPGVLFQERQVQGMEIHPRVLWWRDGEDAATFEELYLGDAVPGSPTFTAGELNGQAFWIWLGGATECDGRACSGVIVRAEQTVWSPDGAHTLFLRELEGSRSPPAGDQVLWLGDRSGVALKRLGEGSYPFWMDNQTFGYLTARPQRQQTFPFSYDLVLQRLDGEQTSEPVTRRLNIVEALPELAPESAEAEEMGVAITRAAVHPARPQTLYLSAVRFTGRPSAEFSPQYTLYLLAVDVESGEISPRIASLHRQWSYAMRFSPDGRWLAHVTYDPEIQDGVLAVHDLTSDPPAGNVWERPFPSSQAVAFGTRDLTPIYDWSQSDGKLLTLEEGIVTVVDPHTRRERQIVPPTAACAYAAWAD